jgi:two-component system, sensor histidine kinase and response regulator
MKSHRTSPGHSPAGDELLRAIPEPALLVDENGCVVRWNVAAGALFDRPTGGPRKQHVTRFLRPAMDGAPSETGVGGPPGWLKEDVIAGVAIASDEAFLPVMVRVGRIDKKAGGGFLLLVSRDLKPHPLGASNGDQRDSRRVQRQLLANLSHELRTPMNAIIGMVELALCEPQTPRVRDYLETARDSSRVMLSLVDDLLDFARIEAGRFELDADPFSVRRVLDSAMRSHSPRASEHGLELLCEVDPDVPDRLIGDSRRFRQVVSNLVGNAVKFTEHGEASVHLATEDRGSDFVVLRLDVRDTGMGIAGADHQRIFEAFTQIDPSSTRRHSGAGLGLTISREIVERMQGRLWLKSLVGHGSTFSATMRFGVMKRHPGGGPKPVGELEALPVLVVDDNAANRRILEKTLTSWSMRPVSVGGARAAVQLIDAANRAGQPYPLLIVDGAMPEMDGCALITTLKQRGLIGHAHVLMLTSDGPVPASERTHDLPVSAYLEKPVSQSALLDTIVTLLNGPPRRREEVSGITRTKAPLSVLVAEDTPANRKVVEAILTKRGHRFDVVPNGREAVEQCRRARYDAVLMDVQMPVMDGLSATERIRTFEDRQSLPIIAMTAHAMRGDRERCLEAGMNAYVPKPIAAMELLDVLEASVAQSRRLQCSEKTCHSQESKTMASGLHEPSDRTGPVLNLAIARQRLGGDEELLRDLANFFIEDAPRLLDDTRQALDDRDLESATRSAHSLKGLASNFEAVTAVEWAQKLETSARSGQIEGSFRLVGPLAEEVGRVMDALRREVLG